MLVGGQAGQFDHGPVGFGAEIVCSTEPAAHRAGRAEGRQQHRQLVLPVGHTAGLIIQKLNDIGNFGLIALIGIHRFNCLFGQGTQRIVETFLRFGHLADNR